jgi:hypothetical protein
MPEAMGVDFHAHPCASGLQPVAHKIILQWFVAVEEDVIAGSWATALRRSRSIHPGNASQHGKAKRFRSPIPK